MSTSDPSSATLAGAFARHENGAWHIGNDLISITLAWKPGSSLQFTELTLHPDCHWDFAASTLPFTLQTSGNSFAPPQDLKPSESRVWTENGAVRMEIGVRARDGSSVAVQLECHDGQAVVRQWLEVLPAAPLTVERVEPVRLAIKSADVSCLHAVSGVQRQGGWRAEQGLYRSFRLESQPLDGRICRQSGIRSTWDETPWTVLTGDDATNGGIMLALEYGGQWELCAETDQETGSVATSFSPVGIAPQLATGERWVSPSVWLGAFAGDLDSAAAVMHDYVRDVVVPPTDETFPWVQYNTWFSYYCDLDAQTLLAEADIASELGVEVFYVDAGWWIGNPQRRDRFSSGLGNWVENREKFPNGLRAFADQIRERGMHFGLWVEPERVDLRTATTGTWSPDWIAREGADRYVRCDWPSDTDTAWLCFGHRETQAWAERWISELVEELGIRWLKWDSNYWGVCTSPGHGHGVGDAEAAQLLGVYKVMHHLRSRFPDLIVENCAGGATRMDFAIARHTHVAWLNDASQPAHRSRFHNAGASYLFPPHMLNAWITESEHENVNGQDLPDPVWRSILRSRMIGAIGFSCQLVSWSDQIRLITREEVLRYKEELRPLLRTGRFYHLLPQPEIPSDLLSTPDVWEAYGVSSLDGDRHIVLGFRNASTADSRTVPVSGIQPDQWYQVIADGAAPKRYSGHDLIADGLELSSSLLASTWVTIILSEESDGGGA